MAYQYDKQFEQELWQANKKEWFNLQYLKARKFVEDHPIIAGLGVTVASSLVKGTINEVRHQSRMRRINDEQAAKERTFYDRSINAYYHTRRTPSTKQKAKIAERKRNGETYDVILKDMGLL